LATFLAKIIFAASFVVPFLFFSLSLAYISFFSHYELNHALKKHGYDLNEIYEWTPLEREFYVTFIRNDIENSKNKNKSGVRTDYEST
jgi:hypothetical protein